jgi:hypothetical protein
MSDDGYMRSTFAQGKKAAVAKLLELRQQAQRDKEPRMMLRNDSSPIQSFPVDVCDYSTTTACATVSQSDTT